jgi:hypothetical protein
MNEEAQNTTSESEASTDEPKEEKKSRPARKSTKKVVSRVRDAKTKTAPKDAPEGGSDADSGDQGRGADQNDSHAVQEIPMVVEEAPRESKSNGGREERRRQGRGRRAAKTPSSSGRALEPVDPEELSKRAWKIYQADVAEEGITLIDNSTGRQLALRSFELARVFLEEQARQVKLCKPPKESRREKEPSNSDQKAEEKVEDEGGDS